MFFEKLRKQVRWIILVIVLAFVVTTVFYVGAGQVTQTDSPPIATVNGRNITYAQFQRAYASNAQVYRTLFGAVQGSVADELMYLSLRSLIETQLMYEAAEKAALPVSNDEITAVLNDLKASFSDESAYRQALIRSGLTERELREMIREDLRLQKLQEQVMARAQLNLTEEELAELDEESIEALRQAAQSEELRKWLDELWAQAEIVIHDTRLRAHDLVRQGRLEEAIAAYEQAIAENPFDAYLHLALGSVYQELGRIDEAVAEYEQAVDLNDQDADLRITLALAYLDAGRDEDAAAVLRETGEQFAANAALQFTLAQLFMNMGLTEDAQAAMERLQALQPAATAEPAGAEGEGAAAEAPAAEAQAEPPAPQSEQDNSNE
ncbi:MAG: SurA N-terminal domain-containing protein [Limnochordales bacterium]